MKRCHTTLFAGFIVLFSIVSCQKEILEEEGYRNQGNIPLDEYEELIELSDTSTLKTFEDFDYRIDRIQQIFADQKDGRGAFPTVYKAITRAAYVSMQEDHYDYPEYGQKFVMDFSKRYLYYLRHHLLDEPLEHHWELYYRHAMKNTHITRLVLEGINAHLTIDLTRALGYTGVTADFRRDWIQFGDVTVQYVPGFLAELLNEYDTDASDVFGVFFIGDIFDEIFGEGAAVNFGFNLLRIDAFKNAIRLQHEQRNAQIEQNLMRAFNEREFLLDMLDNMNMTP